jgi:uncharacterized RDD family membrane protein YckC
MKTCPSCGREMPDDADFCKSCGKRLGNGPAFGFEQAEPLLPYAPFFIRGAAFVLDQFILFASFLILDQLGLSMEDGEISAWAKVIAVVVSWMYYALLESSGAQATPGKAALGLKVTDEEGRRISFARASGRHFAKIFSWLIVGIGFVMAAFTAKRQALHDKVAGTLVLRRKG